MEADFSGWATKVGLRCSDGRTIMQGAFKHQDTMTVPLVWQHGHADVENVLGHAVLESRPEGVYCHGFFNKTGKAAHARELVEHGDIKMMSIWANELVEKSKKVFHGAIREVSLVLSGANPGALIENVTIRHGDDETDLDDEAIIYTGLEFEHSVAIDEEQEETEETEEQEETEEEQEETEDTDTNKKLEHKLGEEDEDIQDIYDSMNEKQKNVLHYMLSEALASVAEDAEHSNLDDNSKNKKGKNEMAHRNVFEDKKGSEKDTHVLTHDAILGIVEEAKKNGSLKDAVQGYALSHGIEDIDILFPDAKAVDAVPEWLKRRTEWVASFFGKARKSPFSRIKTFAADITEEQARAKGYIKGNLKTEEFFSVTKRVTTPTTVYKKQKLDRDDIIDITDFDVVAWLKGEMRLMLDEEVARAALIGDGRNPASEDKISEQSIRPIASDHELFNTTLYVNLGDANSSIQEVIDAIVANRYLYKGSGQPTLYTTESIIAKFLMLKDGLNRRMYKSLDEVAAELRVSEIVPVEVMEEHPDIICVLVNPTDYVFGATRGGEVSMFDDFDIDYNQYKYLIETRCSGALVRLKSAITVRKTDDANVLVSPDAPAFDEETGEITITDQTGVVYKNHDTGTVMNNAGSPYAVAEGTSVRVDASPAAGYYFATSENDTWLFTYNG